MTDHIVLDRPVAVADVESDVQGAPGASDVDAEKIQGPPCCCICEISNRFVLLTTNPLVALECQVDGVGPPPGRSCVAMEDIWTIGREQA